jgi:flagellar hook-associated protein 3 FlgL
MRISTNMMYQRSLRSLQSTTERLDKASEQSYTGDKFSSAGEDPVGMSQKLSLNSKIEQYKQYATNGSLLNNSLSLEETVLTSANNSMMSAYTLMQQSNNSSITDTDKATIASQLQELQKQLYDQMNAKNSNGEYIFGGSQGQTAPFSQDSMGKYIYQGDSTQRQIQVSPTMQISENDSALSVFQSVATQRTASSSSGANLKVSVADQSQFEGYYRNNYDYGTVANNTFQITTTAGSPDQYQIWDSSGTNKLQEGKYSAGTAISYQGLSLTMNSAAGGSTEKFTLDPPQNDNILNTLSDAIAALKDPTTSSSAFSDMIAKTETHLNNAMSKVNSTLGDVGSRLNSLDTVTSANDSLKSVAEVTKADVSEVDVYEAYSNLVKEQNALSTAQQAYTYVNKSSLFDYL